MISKKLIKNWKFGLSSNVIKTKVESWHEGCLKYFLLQLNIFGIHKKLNFAHELEMKVLFLLFI